MTRRCDRACIVVEAADRFGTAEGVPRVIVEHRVGMLAVGESSVAVAVGHARRAPALKAVRYVVQELKHRVPIRKRAHYADGTREWVDPDAGAAHLETRSLAGPAAVPVAGPRARIRGRSTRRSGG